jgi:hypothetical protein
MLLSDQQLKFVRDLIGHWLDVRRGALVPLEDDIDPCELLRWFDCIAIAHVRQPSQVMVELAGAAVNRRFGRDIRRTNWMDLVPPTLGDPGERAREQIRRVPCGFYHKFTVAEVGLPALTAYPRPRWQAASGSTRWPASHISTTNLSISGRQVSGHREHGSDPSGAN